VEVACKGVQPWFGGVKWQAISTTGGFMLTCMTGISQCRYTNDYAAARNVSMLSTSERANCLTDPRYLTWRMMTIKISYVGAQDWYRTDSHWDVASFIISSTWGPGIQLSTHPASEKDNNGVGTDDDVGKTYVFAIGDGSGISINHLSYDAVSPTINSTVGTGSNNIVSSPSAFSSEWPNEY